MHAGPWTALRAHWPPPSTRAPRTESLDPTLLDKAGATVVIDLGLRNTSQTGGSHALKVTEAERGRSGIRAKAVWLSDGPLSSPVVMTVTCSWGWGTRVGVGDQPREAHRAAPRRPGPTLHPLLLYEAEA